jgi:hypothetical protein
MGLMTSPRDAATRHFVDVGKLEVPTRLANGNSTLCVVGGGDSAHAGGTSIGRALRNCLAHPSSNVVYKRLVMSPLYVVVQTIVPTD